MIHNIVLKAGFGLNNKKMTSCHQTEASEASTVSVL